MQQSYIDNEKRLRGALYKTNEAIWTADEYSQRYYERLVKIRDEMWQLGVDMFGWKD